jgi:hypothetical protein
MNIGLVITDEQEVGLKFATDLYNKTAKAEFDRAQALKPVAEQLVYQPVTARQYAQRIFDSACNSFVQQAMAADQETFAKRLAKLDVAGRQAIINQLPAA